jgi:hypothetical protein
MLRALAGSSCYNRVIPVICSKIPYAVEQGIFLSRTGKWNCRTGNCSPANQGIREFKLRGHRRHVVDFRFFLAGPSAMTAFWSLSGVKRTRIGLGDAAFVCRPARGRREEPYSASSLKGAATGTATIP